MAINYGLSLLHTFCAFTHGEYFVQPRIHLEYFVKVNLQLYLASVFTFSILFYMNHFLLPECLNFLFFWEWSEPFYWLVNLMCFSTILLFILRMQSSLFLHHPLTCKFDVFFNYTVVYSMHAKFLILNLSFQMSNISSKGILLVQE